MRSVGPISTPCSASSCAAVPAVVLTTRMVPSATRVMSFGVLTASAMPSSGRRSLRLAESTRSSER